MLRFIFAFLLIGSVPSLALAQRSNASASAAQPTLFTISVRGQASQMADIAVLSAGVTTEAADSKEALRENAARMERVLAAVRAAGVAKEDVHTSTIGLNPRYQYNNRETPRITGYVASNTLSIKVRDITKLGQILDSLVAQGANQIHGPSFQIDHPEASYDQARRNALKMAQARAALYAQALGLHVHRVVSLAEDSRSGNFGPREMVMAAQQSRAASADASTTPVVSGEITVSVNLEVVFELGQ